MDDEAVPDLAKLGEALFAAAESIGLGVIVAVYAPEVKVLHASSAAAALFGLSVEELLLAPPLGFAAPQAREDVEARLGARLRGEQPVSRNFESVLRRRDGTELSVQVGIAAVTIGGQPGGVVFITDLGERKRAEEALRRSEARSRALIESAPDAIVIIRERVISYANPAAASLLGYELADEMVGLSFADFLHPEDSRTMDERLAMLQVGRGPLGPHEYRARKRDGRAIVVEVTSILFDDAGGPAVIGFARDVTESRRMQAQLMRADRLAGLGTMAAGVAHEINNPLAFMMLGLDTIERQLLRPREERDTAALRSTLDDVRHGIDRISTIVRQLRAFSRVDAGPSRGAADLNLVLDAATRMAAHEIKQVGTLNVEIEDGLPPVRGEAAVLEQLFLNLLLNAAQALDEERGGSVTLIARSKGEAGVEILVRDTGRGIEDEDLPRIFDPFFTTKPIGTGTGLGLSICHSIVSALGGEIAIDTKPGEGTTVRVTLPVSRGGTGRSTPPAATPRKGPRALKILVADDEPAFLRAMERLMSGEHEVTAALDGESAWQAMQTRELDVVFLDVTMQGVSGIDLFERLRTHKPELAQRVVFVTAGTSRERVERFLSRAGRPILRKPFDAEKVTTLLRRMRPGDP